jgi:hypothetical protein
MLIGKIKVRPFYIVWLFSILIFAPALIGWIYFIYLGIWHDLFDFAFINKYCKANFYLPLLATILGLTIPIICLRVLNEQPTKVWITVFVIYLIIMLMWGIVDIRCENYQIGGESFTNGDYFHSYITWYFMPYRWIEKRNDNP